MEPTFLYNLAWSVGSVVGARIALFTARGAHVTPNELAQEVVTLLNRGWTNLDGACDENDQEVPVWSSKAVKWSLLGAVAAAGCPLVPHVMNDMELMKIKMTMMGRIRVCMPKKATWESANASLPIVLALLAEAWPAPGRLASVPASGLTGQGGGNGMPPVATVAGAGA